MKSLPAPAPLTLLMLALLLALAGCAGGLYGNREPAPGMRIGTLGVSGSNVFLNGKRARGGEPLRVGDTVSTGTSSSGMIDFANGGVFQLDQDTDPIFVVKRLQAGFCILARIFRGQVFVDKQQFCIETPALDAINNSRINIRVTPRQTGIIVLAGNVSVSRPQAMRIVASQQLIMTLQGEGRVRALGERELADSVRWRKNYTFSGWCCKDSKVYPSDREQCSAGGFSFDRALLEAQCRPRDEPRFNFDFGLPIGGRHRPPEKPNYPTDSRDAAPY